ncbi:MAG: hypothetical protein U0Z44_18480 [Kouleothrix sp.]
MALAEQMAPRYAQQRRRSVARRLTAQRAAIAVLVVAVTMGAVDLGLGAEPAGRHALPVEARPREYRACTRRRPGPTQPDAGRVADRRLTEFNTLVAAGRSDSAVVAEDAQQPAR